MSTALIVSVTKQVKEHYNKTQWRIFFNNRFSLSIINGLGTYGYEAALIGSDGNIVYDENLFYDVVGYMDEEQILNVIHQVLNFPFADTPGDYELYKSEDLNWTFCSHDKSIKFSSSDFSGDPSKILDAFLVFDYQTNP